MNRIRRSYIYIGLLFIASIGIIVFLLLRRAERQNAVPEGFTLEGASIIPIDAVAIFHFDDIRTSASFLHDTAALFPPFFPGSSPVGKLMMLSEGIRASLTISFHYSAKNEVSQLVTLNFSPDVKNEESMGIILRKLGAVKDLPYNGMEIYSGSGLKLFIHENSIVASPSLIIIQSSIRHIRKGSSIMNNSDFVRVLAHTPQGDHRLFINFQQIGKFFSGYLEYKYWFHADFLSKSTSWGSFAVGSQQNETMLSGHMFNFKGKANFSEIFCNIEGRKSDAWSILPYNTYGAFILSTDEFESLIDSYYEYRRSYGTIDEAAFKAARDWLMTQNPLEVVLALVPYKSGERWITLIKSGRGKRSNRKVADSFEHKGALSTLFGRAFSYNEENFIVTAGRWHMIGDGEMIQSFASGNFGKYTMEEFFAQGGAHEDIESTIAPFTVIANISMMQDSVTAIFREPLKSKTAGRFKKNNYQAMVFRIFPDNNGAGSSLTLFSQKLERLREPESELVNIPDTIRIPSGPFLLTKGHSEKLYLEQLQNFKLRLTDDKGEGIWAIPFGTPLRGYVEEVDYFSNKKFQMLFASGNMLFLLDKTGKFVGQFPKMVDSLILLGPKVYNVSNDGFLVMLLHTDNTLRLYDRDCRPVNGWKDISLDEHIENFPELLKVEGKIYWILRTRIRTMIYTQMGEAVGDLSGKNSLLPDTKVKILSGTKVAVTTRKGKEVTLDLENGEVKRLKKEGFLI